ncbi:MAG TPA: F0F1 ATP synthase subunit delta [Candidatus Acidoferrales bacterium]|nr:F0F1 ATP synthase subunit delta [Candidatus Acidoferrales bacterium]
MASGPARRYAKAVFELAQAEGQVDRWSRRLAAVRDLLSNPGLKAVLDNRALPGARRVELVGELATPEMGEEGKNLARLLAEAGRSDVIADLLTEYERLADEAAGRLRATVTTAVSLSDADRKSLAERVSRRLGAQVRLDSRVDPELIGGLVLQVGDRLYDASVATRLQQLRRRLAAT